MKEKEIIEDCNEQEEFCFTSFSNLEVPVDTVVCQMSTDMNCNIQKKNSSNDVQFSENQEEEICYDNSVAFCSKTPQLVTITMKKQPCGRSLKMTASKMCITYPNGQWSCKNLTNDQCQETNVTKIISTEAATQKNLECTEKKLPPICIDPKKCQLMSEEFKCVQDTVPTSIDLKETICDKCVEGRKSFRPVLETIEVCRDTPETICVNTTVGVTWKKWCRNLNENNILEPFSVPAIIGL